MEQHKLLNLNGEYVKLYVTTNQTLPKLLKNSGSLVVFHDINYNKYLGYNNFSFSYKENTEGINYINTDKNVNNNILFGTLFNNYNNNVNSNSSDNSESSEESQNKSLSYLGEIEYKENSNIYKNEGNYLYLGNELIASGWGFDNKNQKDLAIQHLTIIPQYLYKFGKILNKEIEVRSKFQKDIEDLEYLTSTSDISKNYIEIEHFPFYKDVENENKIYIKDIPQILSPKNQAEYKDLEITNDGINQKFIINSVSNNDLYKKEGNIVYVPVGSKLSSYELSFNYYPNNSGNFTKIKYLSLKENGEYENEVINDISPILINNENNSYKFTLTKSYTNNNITLSYNKEYHVVKDLKLTIAETPAENYKNYGGESSIKNIMSTENIIKEHDISIDTLKIIPKYLFYYQVKNVIEPKYYMNDRHNGNSFNINFLNNDFTNVNYEYIYDNKITINYNLGNNSSNYYLFAFGIPSLYNIKEILIKNNQGKCKNISNNFKILNNYKIKSNPKINNNTNNINYNVIFSIYDISNIGNNIEITIELLENNLINVNSSGINGEYKNIFNENNFKYIKFLNYTNNDGLNGFYYFNDDKSIYYKDEQTGKYVKNDNIVDYLKYILPDEISSEEEYGRIINDYINAYIGYYDSMIEDLLDINLQQ